MSLSKEQIKAISGPILILGAGGFLGSNLFRFLSGERQDVYGTIHRYGSWRLEGLPADRQIYLDILSDQSLTEVLHSVQPRTVFNCVAFGAYSFEKDPVLIHRTNYLSAIKLLEMCSVYPVDALIFSGSSSEYGLNCSAPKESDFLSPDSSYAVSKAATAQAVRYYGKIKGIPCVNMRLYSLYGPYEDASRLMPVLNQKMLEGKYPPFVDPETSHDFLWVGDAVEAYVRAAIYMKKEDYGESFNVASGKIVKIKDIVQLTQKLFKISEIPQYRLYSNRDWDHDNWYGNAEKISEAFGWKAETSLEAGLQKNYEWWKQYLSSHSFEQLTKKQASTQRLSVSAVVACYRDARAIPVMYERLKKMFLKENIDYEIIFVNDCSPDNSTEVIQDLTRKDPNVIGILHSRNFGSQAAFLSGLEISTKSAAVIMDGDLQDPPELISDFIREWKKGADIVYGRRIKREMPVWLEWFYKSFYWLFAELSEISIPKNAGDFSLLDRKVIRELVHCPERDFFLRGIRSYIGFKQVGVDYLRPERMFGRSTNNWIKNIGWAKKAIFSFSRTPLHVLSAVGGLMTLFSLLFGICVFIIKIFFPEEAPRGISMLQVSIMTFGSLNLLGLGLLGEYIGKIIEESKRRPRFIRDKKIINGVISEFPETQKHEND